MDLTKIHKLDPTTIIDRPGMERAREDMGEVQRLADSIKANGQISPILVTAGKNYDVHLIAGGRRRAACILLGITVDAVFREDITDLQLREMELEENIQRKDLNWHEQAKLIKDITEIKQKIYGMGSGVPGFRGAKHGEAGWTKQDTADVLGISRPNVSRAITLANAIEQMPELKDAKTADDARKLLDKLEEQAILTVLASRSAAFMPNAFATANDSFIIRDAFDGLRDLAASSFDFADVDTPYGIDLDKNRRTEQSSEALKATARYTEWDKVEYIRNMQLISAEVYRILQPNAWALFWFGIEWYGPLRQVLENEGFAVDVVPGVWYGGAGGAQTMNPQVNLGRSYDTFFICRKGQPAIAKMGRANVFVFDKVPGQHKIHPTEKPMELMLELGRTFTHTGSRWVVPFHGSGNTLRSALKLGCTAVGFELDEQLKLKCMMRIEEDMLTRP